jgi:hypothetical protein
LLPNVTNFTAAHHLIDPEQSLTVGAQHEFGVGNPVIKGDLPVRPERVMAEERDPGRLSAPLILVKEI